MNSQKFQLVIFVAQLIFQIENSIKVIDKIVREEGHTLLVGHLNHRMRTR